MFATEILACIIGLLVFNAGAQKTITCSNGLAVERPSGNRQDYNLCGIAQLNLDKEALETSNSELQSQLNDLYQITSNLMANCCTPPAISGARTDYLSTAVGSSASYTCNPGYTPSGTSFTACLTGGTWATTDFACTAICPEDYVLDLSVGLCFKFVAIDINATAALADCQSDSPNARLVNLDNQAKWNFMSEYLLVNDPDAANYCAWVGMRREGYRYFWQGVDSGDYIQQWMTGEPDIEQADETCTIISRLGLSDWPCNASNVNVHYVCEVPLE